MTPRTRGLCSAGWSSQDIGSRDLFARLERAASARPEQSASRMMEHAGLTGRIIGCAMRVHRALGPGFLESVYQNALTLELRDASIRVECEHKVRVHYAGMVVGEFVADMVVERCILLENKALNALLPAHEAQLVNYLTATGIEVGILLNFGAARLEFRRKSRTYREPISLGTTKD